MKSKELSHSKFSAYGAEWCSASVLSSQVDNHAQMHVLRWLRRNTTHIQVSGALLSELRQDIGVKSRAPVATLIRVDQLGSLVNLYNRRKRKVSITIQERDLQWNPKIRSIENPPPIVTPRANQQEDAAEEGNQVDRREDDHLFDDFETMLGSPPLFLDWPDSAHLTDPLLVFPNACNWIVHEGLAKSIHMSEPYQVSKVALSEVEKVTSILLPAMPAGTEASLWIDGACFTVQTISRWK
jgi:hypothetical protein